MINENAVYIKAETGGPNDILVDVYDIENIVYRGDVFRQDDVNSEHPLKLYDLVFTDGIVRQCVLSDDAVRKYNEVKGAAANV